MVIYKVTNKSYIGLTTRDIATRWQEHCSHGFALYKSICKYGSNNFIISIVDTALSGKELLSKEKYWIKELNTFGANGYNLTTGSEGVFGFKHTEITKIKIGKASKNRKYIRSNEYKQKMSKVMKGKIPYNKGKKLSQAIKKKMSLAQKGKSFNVFKDNILVNEYINKAQCAEDLGLKRTLINHCLNKRRKTHKGFTFKYKDVAVV